MRKTIVALLEKRQIAPSLGDCKDLVWQNTRPLEFLTHSTNLSNPLIFQRFRKMSDKPDSQESKQTMPADSEIHVDGTITPPTANGSTNVNEGELPGGEVEVVPSDAEKLAIAEARATEYQDLYTRSLAEVQNIRRRSAEDVSKAHKFAVESFAESLLPVRDSLEMSLKLENLTMESLKEGVEATLRQLASAMDKNKVIELNPVGEKLDPNRHQAISMVPGDSTDPAVPSGHVVSVLQKGYLINERLLRPALVTVAQ
jgi:molecular chaperone GrpE